ncbi:DciA family protein [Terricaulis sp.]|uniref:DciA family protein n=1 Tax=Terricaulis sp. TaxID=2768686 RepID=UPI003784115B
MSLRDRFRPAQTTASDQAGDEARAAQRLNGQRGRGTIPPAPSAGKAAAALMKPLLKEGAGTMGFHELKRRWSDVAGASFARCQPEKLVAGVLTLRAPAALAPFLQQQAPLLIERLKTAGAKVKTVRIEQRSAPVRPTANVRPLRRALTAAEETALAQALDPVADPALKSALMRLGRAVKQG